MKIAIFSDTFSPAVNGVAGTVHNSARALGELGHEVRVYTVSKERKNKLTQKSDGLYSVVTLPSFSVFVYPKERLSALFGFSLANLFKFKPDIIHVHTPFSVGIEGFMAAKVLKIPVVGTHHTFYDCYLKHVYLDYDWAKKFSWTATVAIYNRANVVISPTKSLRDELLVHGLKKPVEILSNSVNSQVFQNKADLNGRSKENLKNKFGVAGKSLVYMGRVSYEKSINTVIAAMAEAAKTIPEAKLMIIGDGPEKEKLIAMAKQFNIDDKVIFTGLLHGQSLAEALSANDIFVTASQSENMPLAVLEAMSVGLPIIAVSSLGMREIVEDNGNGYLLSSQSGKTAVKDMAETIVKLLTNDDDLKKFGRRSLELAEDYSEQKITRQLVDIYDKVIKAG